MLAGLIPNFAPERLQDVANFGFGTLARLVELGIED
jgi:hypothetical protein